MQKINETLKVDTVVLDTRHTQNYTWRWVIPVSTQENSTVAVAEKSLPKKVQELWNIVGVEKEATNFEELVNHGREY